MENNNTNETMGLQEEQAVKTFTEDEVKDLLQKETDRRVTAALKKAERNKEAEIKEAQKLAQMNEQEKYEHQLRKREEALIEKERAMALLENKAEASKALNSRGISINLADFVVAEDADTMMNNIKVLEDEFKKSVKAEVERRLASTSPTKSLDSSEMTREKFRSLSFREQSELLSQNQKYEQFLN